ncbi:hypothetical protein ON010_g9631 [Phytophthora cinnamomi]|nr:hypothetical protein ON010_g9631 [Phytophthora cinnamomi]
MMADSYVDSCLQPGTSGLLALSNHDEATLSDQGNTSEHGSTRDQINGTNVSAASARPFRAMSMAAPPPAPPAEPLGPVVASHVNAGVEFIDDLPRGALLVQQLHRGGGLPRAAAAGAAPRAGPVGQ